MASDAHRKAVAKFQATKARVNIWMSPEGKEKLTENFNTLMSAIIKAKPAAAKGQYRKSVAVASTMGPGIKLNPARITE